MKMSTEFITTVVLTTEEFTHYVEKNFATVSENFIKAMEEKEYYRKTILLSEERTELLYAFVNEDDDIVIEHTVEETIM